MRAVVLLMICAAVAAAGCGRPTSTSKAQPPASLPLVSRPKPVAPVWRVVSVHDGDTLRAIDEAKVEHKIRLHGIDAPEIGQPFGNVSRDGLTALTKGKAVEVHVEDRDRYGRPPGDRRPRHQPADGGRRAGMALHAVQR